MVDESVEIKGQGQRYTHRPAFTKRSAGAGGLVTVAYLTILGAGEVDGTNSNKASAFLRSGRIVGERARGQRRSGVKMQRYRRMIK